MRTKQKRTAPRAGKIVLLLAAAVVLATGLGINAEITGAFADSAAVDVTISRGAGASEIAGILKESGAIKSSLLFRLYSRFTGADTGFKYGSFNLVPSSGYREIALALSRSGAREDAVIVTVPEGYNAYQIAAKLEDAGLCDSDEFIDVLNTHEFSYSFLGDTPEFYMVKSEGFLFPDTYEFLPDSTPEYIASVFFDTFERKVLTPEFVNDLAASPYELSELVKFASIIQKEAANTEEMYNVASVFRNRMDNTAEYPRLESCTTNDYITDYILPRYEGAPPEDLLDAYDTYGTPGLPVAPIANPGLDALNAALRPNDTPYYFFVTDIEYTHYYGRTYAEHLTNIEKAKAVNLTHGKVGL